MSAKNFPYERPANLYDAMTRPVGRYRANYDRVFNEAAEITPETWAGIPIEIDPDMPRNEIRLRDSAGKVHKITNIKT